MSNVQALNRQSPYAALSATMDKVDSIQAICIVYQTEDGTYHEDHYCDVEFKALCGLIPTKKAMESFQSTGGK